MNKPFVKLKPSKKEALLLGFISSFFVIAGYYFGIKDGKWMGYFCSIFFSLGIIVSIFMLLPNCMGLLIYEDHMILLNLFKKSKIEFKNIEEFFVVKQSVNGMTTNKLVGFNFKSEYKEMNFGRKAAKLIADCEAALPNTYGMKAEELVEILNKLIKL